MKQYNSKFVNVSITLLPEQISMMNILGKERSQYIRKLIESDLFSDDQLNKRQEELRIEIDELEKLKGRDRTKGIEIELNKHWIPYLQNAKAVIERDRNFLKAQRDGFNNTFGENVTTEEFDELLKKVKPNLKEVLQ